MRIALQHGEVSIVGSSIHSPITIEVPRSYQMLEEGVSNLTPTLFRQQSMTVSPHWNLSEEAHKLHLEGIVESSLDVITRFMIRNVVSWDVTPSYSNHHPRDRFVLSIKSSLSNSF